MIKYSVWQSWPLRANPEFRLARMSHWRIASARSETDELTSGLKDIAS